MKLRERLKEGLQAHPRLTAMLMKMRKRRRRWVAAIVLVAHLVGALTSVKAIMEVRTSQGAVAWAVSLNTLPYVAVPAYWVFGQRDFKGYVTARRTKRAELEGFWDDFNGTLEAEGLVVDPEREALFVSEILAKLPATIGNDAELLIDGDATYQSILEGIARAEDYVLVQFYIIQDDSVGRELQQSLINRARAGVRCFMLYDEIGCRLPDSYVEPLVDAGVEVLPFNSTQGGTNRFQINFRNHRKIVVVDGKEAWVGGLNVGEEYKGLDPELGYWRDTHMRVAGPIVQCVQISYAEDWHWAAEESISGLNWDPKPAPSGASKAMLCLPSGPVDPLETCTLYFLNLINNAKERLWIASPYFVPDEQFISALQLAALRGVDVRIMIPDKSDNAMVNLSAWSYLEDLHEVGISVYRYEKGFLHHKVTVIDEQYCTIGTANFDNRSFRLNFELTMGVRDREFTSQVAKMFEADMADSRLVGEGELEGKSAWYRFWVRASRLAAPVQ